MKKDIKVYLNKLSENWIVDRQRQEFLDSNKNLITNYLFRSNLIWIIAPWTWNKINKKYLEKNKVLCTIHHIDDEKIENEKTEFMKRDYFVNAYHVTNESTKRQLKKITKKDIYVEPFWVNSKYWFYIPNKNILKNKYNINSESYVIGSFQRDSEGYDVSIPKLSKGPDRLIEIINDFKKTKEDVHVVLTGKRRDYVIEELKKLNINYSYFEMVNIANLNELYNILDLYIVASRYEGGPQSLYECAFSKTPIISTDVGVSNLILSKESIFNMENYQNAKPNVEYAYKNVEKYDIENSMIRFTNLISKLYES